MPLSSPCTFYRKEESASDNLSKNQNSFCINNGKSASPTIQNEI